MKKEINENKILWNNCEFNGIDLTIYYKFSAYEITKRIIKLFGKDKSFSIIAGLGGNGADGMALALSLSNFSKKVTVYLIGRTNSFTNPITEKLYREIKKNDNINLIVDSKLAEIKPSDVVIEALVGTGLVGNELNRRFREVIKRVSHFDSKIVAIDIPTPHYKPDYTFSILYPKTSDAETINLDIPSEISTFCGPGEYEALTKPNLKTHIKKNGKVLYFSSQIYEQVINRTVKELNTPILFYNFEKSKESVRNDDLENELENADSIVIGNIENNYVTESLINKILNDYKTKNFVFFGTSLEIINPNFLQGLNRIIILDRKELLKVINKPLKSTAIEGVVKRMCIENNFNLILIGSKILLYNTLGEYKWTYLKDKIDNSFKERLAFLNAVYCIKNPQWLSMRASIFSA